MAYESRTTESICRENIPGYIQDIEGLINPVNDGNLAAWMQAKARAEDLVSDMHVVCRAIAARPSMNPGQQALRAIAATPFDAGVNSPEEDAAMDELEAHLAKFTAHEIEIMDQAILTEARRIENAHVAIFDPILNLVRPA